MILPPSRAKTCKKELWQKIQVQNQHQQSLESVPVGGGHNGGGAGAGGAA